MTKSELEKHRLEIVAKIGLAHDAVDAEFQPQLDAIDVLIAASGDKVATPKYNFVKVPTKTPSLQAAVRESIASITGNFSTATLFARIKTAHPSLGVKNAADLSNSVWVLKKAAEIEVVEKGGGPNKPTIYKITDKFKKS